MLSQQNSITFWCAHRNNSQLLYGRAWRKYLMGIQFTAPLQINYHFDYLSIYLLEMIMQDDGVHWIEIGECGEWKSDCAMCTRSRLVSFVTRKRCGRQFVEPMTPPNVDLWIDCEWPLRDDDEFRLCQNQTSCRLLFCIQVIVKTRTLKIDMNVCVCVCEAVAVGECVFESEKTKNNFCTRQLTL